MMIRNMFLNNYDAINNYFVNIINETFLPKIEEWITIVSNGLFGAVKVLFDVIMGFIIAIYFLYDKEIFKAQLKRHYIVFLMLNLLINLLKTVVIPTKFLVILL